VVRVDSDLRAQWIDPGLSAKTGLELAPGQRVTDILEPGPAREQLEAAVREGRRFSADVISRTLRQLRAHVHPLAGARDGGTAWVVLEPGSANDDMGFVRALHEIARAVGEKPEVEAVCAAAVVAMVRCAGVSRAEVYLLEEEATLRRVATSHASVQAGPADPGLLADGALKHALATAQPQLGISRGPELPNAIFAAVPLLAQQRVAGTLVLFKESGASFSVRELDLWSAAAGQLAVAVENARLLREAQTALKIRDEFMSIASHELKTPLTPLKMGLYTMERRIAQGLPVELSSVIKSKRQVDRLAGLVNDLLDASRLELGKLAVTRNPLELGHLVAEVVDEFRVTFDRAFEVTLPKERVWVLGDRDRIEQVLVNLLENAQKYSPPQEAIRVELERRRGEARIRVMDKGIGIPAPEQGHIFERFFRAKNASYRNFGGLGLGLFISRSILQLHEGELLLQSDEGQGSVFTAVLPYLPSREVRKLPKRVLVLEEDPLQEAGVRDTLKAEGFEVLAARDPAEALRKLAQAPVDLMVVATELACRPGGSFMEALHSSPTGRPLPLLFGGEAVPAWASPYAPRCPRPYRSEELAEAVRLALGMPAADPAGDEAALS
jgi:signal transduction histidine kinase